MVVARQGLLGDGGSWVFYFLFLFFMKRRRDTKKEERGQEKREIGGEINILMNRWDK